MLENANEVIIHGYAYQDWIREIPNPQVGDRSTRLSAVHGWWNAVPPFPGVTMQLCETMTPDLHLSASTQMTFGTWHQFFPSLLV